MLPSPGGERHESLRSIMTLVANPSKTLRAADSASRCCLSCPVSGCSLVLTNSPPGSLIVLTQNIWGGAPLWKFRCRSLARRIARLRPDIIGLQEVHAPDANVAHVSRYLDD